MSVYNIFKVRFNKHNCQKINIHTGKKYLMKNVYLSFYFHIFLSYYLNIVCKNIVCELGLNQRFPTCGTRTLRGTWEISRGTPNFHLLKIYTKICSENVRKCLPSSLGGTCIFFFKQKKVGNRCSQFHQHFTYELFVQTLFWQLFSSYMYVEKAARTTLVQKICT